MYLRLALIICIFFALHGGILAKDIAPAIYNDLIGEDLSHENEEKENSELYLGKINKAFSQDVKSISTGLSSIIKKHNVDIGKTPYAVQGLPIIYTSKATGFNLGARMSFANLKYDHPYLYRLAVQYWVSDRGARNHELELDIPSFFSERWHLRLDYTYVVDINKTYFGIGNNSIFNKDFTNPKNPAFISRTYYQYKMTKPNFNINIEYQLIQDRLSLYTGLGFEKTVINPLNYDSTSKMYNEKPYGYKGGKTNYVMLGARYDSRDYPFNASKGSVITFTYTDHAKFIGSDYSYKNLNLSYMGFFSFLKYFTLAYRVMIDQLIGDTPFFALAEFKSYRNYEGLGGDQLLRGAPAFRYIDNLKLINQIELRTRFYNGIVFGQHVEFYLTPFWDIGRVWDRKKALNKGGLHSSFGTELRFTWNSNFITSFTMAGNSENFGTYLSFGENFN